MHIVKNGILGIGLAAVCGYSLFQKLQWPAVLSLVLLIGLLYWRYTLDLIEGCLALLHTARVAKFSQIDWQSERTTLDPSKTLREMMLADLTPRDLSLLLTVYQAKRWPVSGAVRDCLREISNRGWLAHDANTLDQSNEVWLTSAGEAVAEAISPKIHSADITNPSEVRQANAAAPKKDRAWFERELAVLKAEMPVAGGPARATESGARKRD